ncbi:MAG: hypothetical protein ACRDQU_22920 [Pseudonocardiaceae bacterium]
MRAGMIDELLADTDYVLHADFRRLSPAVAHARTPAGLQRARLLWLTPRAIPAEAPERLALLSVTETLEDLGTAFRHHPQHAPYRGLWANTPRRVEQAVLDGHTGWVNGVCAVRVGDRELLASASADGTVRIWDPGHRRDRAHPDRAHRRGEWGVCGAGGRPRAARLGQRR